MQKLKTKKGVAKRFRITKKGKITYHACGKRHLLTSKKSSRTRKLRRASVLQNEKQTKYLKEMLPYG